MNAVKNKGKHNPADLAPGWFALLLVLLGALVIYEKHQAPKRLRAAVLAGRAGVEQPEAEAEAATPEAEAGPILLFEFVPPYYLRRRPEFEWCLGDLYVVEPFPPEAWVHVQGKRVPWGRVVGLIEAEGVPSDRPK